MANGKQKPKVELIPDKWVYLQLLQEKPATGEGEYGTWHLYSVKFYNYELKLWEEKSFFPSVKLQALIEHIGIKPRTSFMVMEKATKNLNTKKTYTYFDVEYEKERFSTKDVETTPESLPEILPPPSEEDELLGKPPEPPEIEGESSFADTAILVWETVLAWVTPKSVEDLTPDQYVSTRLKIVEICSSMVNTIQIQNGKR